VSDIDTVVVDSLKALDPKRPIREADMEQTCPVGSFVPLADIDSFLASQPTELPQPRFRSQRLHMRLGISAHMQLDPLCARCEERKSCSSVVELGAMVNGACKLVDYIKMFLDEKARMDIIDR